VHDLRRSGVREMIRSGINQTVAMRISGHLTAVFARYDITSTADIEDAMEKRAARIAQVQAEQAAAQAQTASIQ